MLVLTHLNTKWQIRHLNVLFHTTLDAVVQLYSISYAVTYGSVLTYQLVVLSWERHVGKLLVFHVERDTYKGINLDKKCMINPYVLISPSLHFPLPSTSFPF